MKRGDVVVAVLPRDHGKPRPAVVIQSDRLSKTDSVLVCPFTSDLTGGRIVRVRVAPSAANGLRLVSEIMVEKITAAPRAKCGDVIGRLDDEAIERLDAALALAVGLLD